LRFWIISSEDCEKTINEFWEQRPDLDRFSPSTWDDYWQYNQLAHLGIMNSVHPFVIKKSQVNYNVDISPMMVRNRMNPNLHAAYSILFQTPELIVDHDRLGVLRPTKKVPFPDVEKDMPEWKTIDKWLHLDSNPITGICGLAGFNYYETYINLEENFCVQGLIALTDATEDDGGFHCVPGFHKHLKDYALSLTTGITGDNIQIARDDPIRNYIQKVPVRQGSICIWNTMTPHANFPNNSSNFRFVQYCRMAPKKYQIFKPLIKAESNYSIELTDLGRKLFGIDEW